MVPRDNMSDPGGPIIAITEGPILTFLHTQLSAQWNPKIRLHTSPVILLSAAFGAVIPFVKANVFLPACAGLMGNLILQMNGLH